MEKLSKGSMTALWGPGSGSLFEERGKGLYAPLHNRAFMHWIYLDLYLPEEF